MSSLSTSSPSNEPRNNRIQIAIISNLKFNIKGRDYGSEDKLLASELRKHNFQVEILHPETILPLNDPPNAQILQNLTVLFFRNNYGGHLEQAYRHQLSNFITDTNNPHNSKIFNDFQQCHGDYQGKQHLLDLYSLGFPVIPSTRKLSDLTTPPFNPSTSTSFMVKSMTGADSNDMQGNLTLPETILKFNALEKKSSEQFVIQPMMDFVYEVSFYYFEGMFMYAMYNGGSETMQSNVGNATDTEEAASAKRWTLQIYEPTTKDLIFASKFIKWNNCHRQILRIDAIRLLSSGTKDKEDSEGELLLMEIEDYNCWLSLSELKEQAPNVFTSFIAALSESITKFAT